MPLDNQGFFSTIVLNLYFLNWAVKVVRCIECIDKISIHDVNIIRMQHAFLVFLFQTFHKHKNIVLFQDSYISKRLGVIFFQVYIYIIQILASGH